MKGLQCECAHAHLLVGAPHGSGEEVLPLIRAGGAGHGACVHACRLEGSWHVGLAGLADCHCDREVEAHGEIGEEVKVQSGRECVCGCHCCGNLEKVGVREQTSHHACRGAREAPCLGAGPGGTCQLAHAYGALGCPAARSARHRCAESICRKAQRESGPVTRLPGCRLLCYGQAVEQQLHQQQTKGALRLRCDY